MQTEVEAKFLNANHDALRARLKELGAVCRQPMRLMRRRNFDYPDLRLQKIGGWIRVRDEGDKITLSYKQLNDRSLHGTKEVNLVVNDFDKASDFLSAIGLKQKTYQETKRESWSLEGAEIELDEWPWVNPYMEIEAANEETLKGIVKKLGLEWTQARHGSVEIVYIAHYDVTEEEVDMWPEIKFIPAPDWLLARRKK